MNDLYIYIYMNVLIGSIIFYRVFINSSELLYYSN